MRFNRQLAKISNGSVAPAIEENKELKDEANITDIKYNSAENIIEEVEGLRKTFRDARQKNVKKYIENLVKENNTNENKQSFEHKESSSENTEFVFNEVMGKMLPSLIKKMLHSFDKKIKIWLESNENLKEGSNKDENIFGNKESSSTQKKYKSIYKTLKKEIYQLFEKEFGTFANKFDMEYFINSLVSQMNEVFGENSQYLMRQNVKKTYKSIHYFLKNISKMISKALIFKRDRNEDTFDESHSINNAKLANESPKENEAAPEEKKSSLWPFFRAASRSQLRAEQQGAVVVSAKVAIS
ncbi:hypothetical protein CEXT_686781 [Caerostris extrusa]|uniref:Uncharacterized protein n=1 Tax=Caerostris extrusa TaxID=172846 RepID=A0AAV4XZF5_CAEEX|nr:hypothetical protein CEXT_686781 [Caerostris extrusa]